MTVAWNRLRVGDRVVYEGTECHIRAIRPSARSIRVVLEPLAENLEAASAKFAIKVKAEDQVELPEGVEAQDHAGKAVTEILGGVPLGDILDSGEIVCPVMDEFTIMAHLKVFHGVELRGLPITSTDELIQIHNELHEAPFHEPRYEHKHLEAVTP